jgi:3-methyladenine DNA glycosylase AlkC
MEYGNGVTTKKNPNGNSLYKTQNTSSFGLEFGRKRFFNKNLFIEKSVAFNLPNNFWHTSSDTKYSSIEDFNETHMNYYMSKNRTVQFHLSVGLAF